MKKKKREPVIVKALSFAEMLESVREQGIACKKKLEENDGRCIKCNKNKANLDSQINPFMCNECNEEGEKILRQLRGPGFGEFRIPL